MIFVLRGGMFVDTVDRTSLYSRGEETLAGKLWYPTGASLHTVERLPGEEARLRWRLGEEIG
jgi:hypothetical protein